MFHIATIKLFSIGENPFNKIVLFKHESKEDLKLSFMESISVEFFPDINHPDISDDLKTIIFGDNEAKIEFVSIEQISKKEFEINSKSMLSFN